MKTQYIWLFNKYLIMSAFVGSSSIKGLYVGNSRVKAVYVGSSLVWGTSTLSDVSQDQPISNKINDNEDE